MYMHSNFRDEAVLFSHEVADTLQGTFFTEIGNCHHEKSAIWRAGKRRLPPDKRDFYLAPPSTPHSQPHRFLRALNSSCVQLSGDQQCQLSAGHFRYLRHCRDRVVQTRADRLVCAPLISIKLCCVQALVRQLPWRRTPWRSPMLAPT